MIYVTGSDCSYFPWVPENLAMPPQVLRELEKFVNLIVMTLELFIFFVCFQGYSITWMENLSYSLGVVSIFLEVLRQSCKIAGSCAPVAIEVVEVKRVWSSAC